MVPVELLTAPNEIAPPAVTMLDVPFTVVAPKVTLSALVVIEELIEVGPAVWVKLPLKTNASPPLLPTPSPKVTRPVFKKLTGFAKVLLTEPSVPPFKIT